MLGRRMRASQQRELTPEEVCSSELGRPRSSTPPFAVDQSMCVMYEECTAAERTTFSSFE